MINKNKERVVFYMETKNKILLQNECDLLQVKASFYIRNCLLEKLGRSVVEVKPRQLDTKSYTLQLLKIGNNLNQIAKKLNSGAKFMIADQTEVLKDIDDLKKHVVIINSKLGL